MKTKVKAKFLFGRTLQPHSFPPFAQPRQLKLPLASRWRPSMPREPTFKPIVCPEIEPYSCDLLKIGYHHGVLYANCSSQRTALYTPTVFGS